MNIFKSILKITNIINFLETFKELVFFERSKLDQTVECWDWSNFDTPSKQQPFPWKKAEIVRLRGKKERFESFLSNLLSFSRKIKPRNFPIFISFFC